MPAKTIVIVPPVLLVRMFGVPEHVKMPTKNNPEVTFDAHGRRFTVRRINPTTYTLSCLLHDPRMRFGTANEIAEDIGHVLETGRLPHAKTSVC